MSAVRPLARSLAAFLCLVAVASAKFGGPPDWVEKVAALPTPPEYRNAPALVLMDDTLISVHSDGTIRHTHRWAIRILTPEGKRRAIALVYYTQMGDKVRGTNAWLVREGGLVRPSLTLDWLDRSIDNYGSLYTERRCKSITRIDEAVPGDIFAAETELETTLLTTSVDYDWGWDLPVLEETCRIKTPPGFTIAPQLHGERLPDLSRSADGRENIWTVRNQPFARAEPLAPGVDPSHPMLSVTLKPPGDARFPPVALSSWADVARWLQSLNAAQCDTSPELVATARRLTANAATPVSKIRAIGTYVQNLRYISIDEGLHKGLGYQARKASQAFASGYGDCKDKANLMRAMLREAGIDSFLAIARSGDDRTIWADVPSPRQFDHAIICVRVDEDLQAFAAVTQPGVGRLLFFDPTAPQTVVGDLPWYLQGTQVLPLISGIDALVRLPQIAPGQGHLFRRHLVARLASDGSTSGHASVRGSGQAGAAIRQDTLRASSPDERRNYAATLLGETLRGATLSAVTCEEESDGFVCGVTLDFKRSDQLQFMPGGLAVARMDLLGRRGLPNLSAPERHRAVKLQPVAFDDIIELELPEKFSVEELPASLTLETPYGKFRRQLAVGTGKITLTRTLELPAQIVPAADYAKLRKFLRDLAAADRVSVVLKDAGAAP